MCIVEVNSGIGLLIITHFFLRVYRRSTRMLTLKFLHKIDKTVYTLDGHGVVQAGPHTADRPVAFDAYDAAFSGSFHKSGIQFGGIGTEVTFISERLSFRARP